MNQDEWLVCNDPKLMLEGMASRISDRQLKLFSVACYYQIEDFLSREARSAVEVFKADIEGKIEQGALSKAEGMLESELLDPGSSGTLGGIVNTYVLMLFDSSALEAAQEALKAVNRVTPWTLSLEQQQPDVYENECIKAQQSQMTVLADQLRKIADNLF